MKLGTNDIGSVYLGTNAVQKVYLGTNEVWSSYAYLLDDYSGAAAAYSLRLLRSAYTGDAIKVRRASDNTEQDIGFVNNELDVATLESFCSGTNGFVTTWYDQSGNGRNATQTTAANQPQIVSSGSVITKGTKPSIQFDGTNDELINTSSLTFSDVTLVTILNSENSSQDSTAIMVNKSTTGLIAQGFGGLGTSDVFGTRTRNPFPGDINVDKSKSGVGTNQLLAFNFGIVGVASPTNTLYVDNNLETATLGSRSTINVTNFVTIGSRQLFNYFNGKFSEAIVYLSDESANRTGIEDNINDFYSIY
jgi:hypothetical protein